LADEPDSEIVDKLLKGRTMSVYALLLSHGPMGVREVQRALGFSSPSLALHHLTKLMDLDLVTKDEHGVYEVSKTVRVGSLSLFVKLGSTLLPRFLFLLTFVAAMAAAYLLAFASWPLSGPDVMFLALATITALILIYETRKMWLLKPF
jgi:predicted DNA-binding transcriptional regulator